MSIIPKTQLVSLVETPGSYDAIKTVEVESPQITSPKDIIIKNKYAGVNFLDVYFRKGIYPAEKPFTFGQEASGVIVAIGDEVTKFKVGDNVVHGASKSYAQYTKITEDFFKITKLDKNVTESEFQEYAAILLQGLTAITFITESYNVKKDDFILVWAAAGGVGSILVQLATQRGAKVIAIASTSEKLEKAKTLGAKYTINYKTEDVVARVKEITNGEGVAASFDSVGKDSFEISMESLARKGTFVSFGNSSGMVAPFMVHRLSAKNIIFVRPSLLPYIATKEEYDHYSSKLLNGLKSGELKVEISAVFPLEEYAKATEALESGKTSGKLIIKIPQ